MLTSALVFACYHRACAPPPVGSGGSSKGGGGANRITPPRYTPGPKAGEGTRPWGKLVRTPTAEQIKGRLGSHFGKGIDSVFGGGASVTTNPFPKAKRSKSDPTMYDSQHVSREMMKPVTELKSFDPRTLVSTQSGITRAGVSYYLGKEYARTGKTFADQDQHGNQYPVVYHKKTTGELILLAGNHRAVADLVSGRPVRARYIESP